MEIKKRDGLWVSGTHGGCEFQAKVYDKGSMFGIDAGRVSKLCVWREDDHHTVFSYDRGYEVNPETAEAREIVKAIILELERLSKLWS